MSSEYKKLRNRFDELSEIIKKGNSIGVVKRTPPEIFQEQNDVAVKMMKFKNL